MTSVSIPDDFLDEDGHVVGWHSGAVLDKNSLRPFLHVGTEAQARMRGGKALSRIVMRNAKANRLRDLEQNQWSRDRLIRAKRTGAGFIIYLNRCEGVPLNQVIAAQNDPRLKRARRPLDKTPDALFRKIFPSSCDSIIVLDESLILSIDVVEEKEWPAKCTKSTRS